MESGVLSANAAHFVRVYESGSWASRRALEPLPTTACAKRNSTGVPSAMAMERKFIP